jgi:hypothetical protein
MQPHQAASAWLHFLAQTSIKAAGAPTQAKPEEHHQQITAMHDSRSPEEHRWQTPIPALGSLLLNFGIPELFLFGCHASISWSTPEKIARQALFSPTFV